MIFLDKSINYILTQIDLKKGTINKYFPYESRINQYIVALFSIYFLVLFYITAFGRLDYPFDLEWMEGGSVEHTIRVLHGKGVYQAPTPEFVPYIYTPMSYYVSAVFSYIFGEGYFSGRIVSIISISLTFFYMYRLILFETKNHFLGVISIGIFASCYIISGNWFDIGRVDSLFTFFIITAIYYLRTSESQKVILLSSLLVFLSFFTKQSSLIIYPAFIILAFSKNYKTGFYYTLILVGSTYLCIKTYDLLTDNWFSYYVFQVGSGHELLGNMIKDFWKIDLFEKFGYFSIIGLTYYCILFLHPIRKTNLFYILVGGGILLMSYFGRIHSGGYTNVLIPLYLILSIFVTLSFNGIAVLSKKTPVITLSTCLGLLCLFQFNELRYKPFDYIPSKEDITAGEKLIEIIKNAPGPVFVSSHGYYEILGNNAMNAHFMASYDLLRSIDHPGKELIKNETINRITSKYYHTIIQDNDYFIDEVNENYDKVETIEYSSPSTFMPKSGAFLRPTTIYIRKNQ